MFVPQHVHNLTCSYPDMFVWLYGGAYGGPKHSLTRETVSVSDNKENEVFFMKAVNVVVRTWQSMIKHKLLHFRLYLMIDSLWTVSQATALASHHSSLSRLQHVCIPTC